MVTIVDGTLGAQRLITQQRTGGSFDSEKARGADAPGQTGSTQLSADEIEKLNGPVSGTPDGFTEKGLGTRPPDMEGGEADAAAKADDPKKADPPAKADAPPNPDGPEKTGAPANEGSPAAKRTGQNGWKANLTAAVRPGSDYPIVIGDTLGVIAKSLRGQPGYERATTSQIVAFLAKANNIDNPNKIYAGRTLKVPAAMDASGQDRASGTGNAAGGAEQRREATPKEKLTGLQTQLLDNGKVKASLTASQVGGSLRVLTNDPDMKGLEEDAAYKDLVAALQAAATERKPASDQADTEILQLATQLIADLGAKKLTPQAIQQESEKLGALFGKSLDGRAALGEKEDELVKLGILRPKDDRQALLALSARYLDDKGEVKADVKGAAVSGLLAQLENAPAEMKALEEFKPLVEALGRAREALKPDAAKAEAELVQVVADLEKKKAAGTLDPKSDGRAFEAASMKVLPRLLDAKAVETKLTGRLQALQLKPGIPVAMLERMVSFAVGDAQSPYSAAIKQELKKAAADYSASLKDGQVIDQAKLDQARDALEVALRKDQAAFAKLTATR